MHTEYWDGAELLNYIVSPQLWPFAPMSLLTLLLLCCDFPLHPPWNFSKKLLLLLPGVYILSTRRNGCCSSLNGEDWANTWLAWDNVYRQQGNISALSFPNFTSDSSVFHPGKSMLCGNSHHSLCHMAAAIADIYLLCYWSAPLVKSFGLKAFSL